MKLDANIKSVIEKLQIKFKKEFGEEISQEDIFTIVDSQFSSVATNMKKGEIIKLDKLGKFLMKEGRVEALKSIKKQI